MALTGTAEGIIRWMVLVHLGRRGWVGSVHRIVLDGMLERRCTGQGSGHPIGARPDDNTGSGWGMLQAQVL